MPFFVLRGRPFHVYIFVHISETFDIFITVVTYCNENDALSAISSKPETFHVAIVEVMVDYWLKYLKLNGICCISASIGWITAALIYRIYLVDQVLGTLLMAWCWTWSQVTTSNHNGNFKFLEAAKDLPTISMFIPTKLCSLPTISWFLMWEFHFWTVISNIHCLSTMMKCIAVSLFEL